MKITPLEIRQKTFEKVFRGYDKDEVNAYLKSLSMEWERLLDENKELYQRIENLETESKKLRELESSLFKTLKTAEDTGATLIEQAKKETDLKIKESILKADTLLNEARNKAKNLIENAESKRKHVLDEMISKVRSLENLFNQMVDLKEKVVGQVKNYSNDLVDRIEKLEKKSDELHVRDIVEEAKKTYNSAVIGEGSDIKNNSVNDEDDKTKNKVIPNDKKVVVDENISIKESEVDEGNATNKQLSEEGGKVSIAEETEEKKSSVREENEKTILKKDNKEIDEIGIKKNDKKNKPASTSFFDEIE
jgi:cell division initiation protein